MLEVAYPCRSSGRFGEHVAEVLDNGVRERRLSSKVKLARFSSRRARIENQISTWFSHEQ